MRLVILLMTLAALPWAAGAKNKPKDITESQRTRVRELERDYAKLQVQIVQAQWQQEKLRAEYLTMIGAMKETCTDKEEFDEDKLACKAKSKPEAEKKP